MSVPSQALGQLSLLGWHRCVAASPSLLPAPQCHSGVLGLLLTLHPPQTHCNSQFWCANAGLVFVQGGPGHLTVRVVPLAKDIVNLRCSCPTRPPQVPLVRGSWQWEVHGAEGFAHWSIPSGDRNRSVKRDVGTGRGKESPGSWG